MALHGLSHVTIGVPNLAETAAYYTEFGLTPKADNTFATTHGGDQLKLVSTPRRRLVELGVAAEDADDLGRIAHSLQGLGIPAELRDGALFTQDPATGTPVRVAPKARIRFDPVTAATAYNGPGRHDRTGRGCFAERSGPVQPRKLGHAVVATTDLAGTMRFFVDGLGFRISDYMEDKGAFLRCSDEHHNVLVLSAPCTFLHHTSWHVDDIDEVGRGAKAMLDENPEWHVWGLGRHFAGSNFFWYLRDPAGNFSEYYSDMDVVPEDELWSPEVMEGLQGLYAWGPPPPPSFLSPDDLAELMTGNHGM